MTSKINTSQQSATTHGCCGSQASKEKAVAVAKPGAAPSAAAKRSAPAEATDLSAMERGLPMRIK